MTGVDAPRPRRRAAAAPPAAPAAAPRSAVQKRAQQPLLAATWALAALVPTGPLRFPVEAAPPPVPKRRYRSAYVPPDPAALVGADLAALSDFELALHVIDFSPLEPLLAAAYRPSRKGQVPFHPVSLFLCVCLRRDLAWSWRHLAGVLAGVHGAGWRAHCGFQAGATPSASGLRYFFQTVGAAVFDALCPRFIALLREQGRFPEQSTYPGDPPTRGVTVSQDGMLQPARHRAGCWWATDACYQPLPTPGEPAAPPDAAASTPLPAAGRRPCRARDKQREGCTCATPACVAQCVRASARDPDARCIHYAGHNHKRAAAGAGAGAGRPAASRGTDVFGYRSIAERVLDDRFAVAWTLRSGLYPAATDERTVFGARLQALQATFPTLRLGEWLDDAGVGYPECLTAVWAAGALRMIDIRADPTDANPQACVARGYDGQGRPLCPHGYRLRANGYDAGRRRSKYVCAQACRREPLPPDGPVQPVAGCPYLDPAQPSGLVVNVGRTLPDGSVRLAREIPYGSPRWKARYGRRNLSESRNGQLAGLGLKRLPAYGLARGTKEIQVGDFVVNLRTLGRLVREATAQAAP
jgi:hypothetical protein